MATVKDEPQDVDGGSPTVEGGRAASPDAGCPAPDAPGAAQPYRVFLDLFEGPLDLLLHLIKKNEVDIVNIPVARITEQYLAYLDLMRDLNLDIAGEYLVMAATLTLVKSRMLLPSPEPEEGEEPDPRADLIRQLLEYQRYREAAQTLAGRPFLRRDVFVREASADGVAPDPDAKPLARVTLWELMEAFRAVLKRAQPDAVHQLEAEPVSLRDRIQALLQTLGVARTLTFDSLFGDAPARGYLIVTFLAVLELMKLGAIEAVQEETLGPILIVLAVDDASQVTIDLLDEYDSSGSLLIGTTPSVPPEGTTSALPSGEGTPSSPLPPGEGEGEGMK